MLNFKMVIFGTIGLIGFFVLFISAFIMDHDFGHDVDVSSDGIQGFLSMKIISIFLTAFGASGTCFLNYNDSIKGATIVGLLVGFLMAYITRCILKGVASQQASSTTETADFINKTGEVKTPIPENGIGEIAFVSKGKRIYIPAREKNGKSIQQGMQIKVLSYNGSSAIVEMLK